MTRKGVWNLQQVRDKYLQSLWTNDDRLFGWGGNGYGNLGQNGNLPTNYSSPIQIDGDWTGASLFLSNNTSRNAVAAVKSDGTLWAWGQNYRGQLGHNNTTYYSSPTQIPGTTWNTVSSGGEHTVATKTDGTLWVWGTNAYGTLGQNSISTPDTTGISSPVQVPGTDWQITNKYQCVGGEQASYGIKTNGTLWSWGLNERGQLGLNDQVYRSSPVQVGSETTWSKICGNKKIVGAIKTDGTLWTWGLNNWDGQLGLNDKTDRSSPTQIPGTSWKDIFVGDKNMSATRTDGTLWVWGQNDRGNLGLNDGSNDRRSSPVQLPGTNWNQGVMAENMSMWSKTDGTLWVAGLNNTGVLGQNTTIWRSSPIQVGSDTNWDGEISVTQEGMYALKATLTPSQL